MVSNITIGVMGGILAFALIVGALFAVGIAASNDAEQCINDSNDRVAAGEPPLTC